MSARDAAARELMNVLLRFTAPCNDNAQQTAVTGRARSPEILTKRNFVAAALNAWRHSLRLRRGIDNSPK